MAIQVPKLNPIAQAQPVPSGRITAQPRDVTESVAQQSNTFERAATDVLDHYEKEQLHAAKTIAASRALDYQAKFDELYSGKDGLKYQRGEQAFTTRYKDTVDKLEEYKKAVISSNPDMSDYAKIEMRKKFDEMDGNFHTTLSTFAGNARADFEKVTDERSIDLLKRKAVADLGFTDKKGEVDPSYLRLTLAKISTIRHEQSSRLGTYHVNSDGSKAYDDETNYNIAKDRSDAIYGALSNLASTPGGAAKAAKLLPLFEKELDEVNRPKLQNKITNESLKYEAHIEANKLLISKDQSSETITKRIDELAKKNPSLGSKTLDVYYNEIRKRKALSENQDKLNYNLAAQIVREKVANSKIPYTLTDMQNDPRVAPLRDLIRDDKLRKNLDQIVSKPLESNPTARHNAFEKLFSGELKSMKLEDVDSLVVGLNDRDEKKIRDAHEKFNTQTEVEEVQMISRMSAQIDDQMSKLKMIKSPFGFYTDEEKAKITTMRDEVLAAIKLGHPGKTVLDQNKWLHDFILAKKNKTIFVNPNTPTFNGGITPQTVSPTPAVSNTTTVPAAPPTFDDTVASFNKIRKAQGKSELVRDNVTNKYILTSDDKKELTDFVNSVYKK